MAINIDTTKFNEAHEAFKQWMLEASNGVPFVNFDHPFLYEDEIRYKHAIYSSAKEVLNLDFANGHPLSLPGGEKESKLKS